MSSIPEIITAAIVERLEAGVRPWVSPLTGGPPPRPRRACGTPYAGINRVWLWLVAEARGFASPYWMTYRQARTLGGQVRRGARSTIAVFYRSYRPSDDDEADERRVLRAYAIFNADEIDGLPDRFHAAPAAPPSPAGGDPSPDVVSFFARLPAAVMPGAQPCYDRARDVIAMPAIDRFADRSRYYATLAHEQAHWTGHESRLGRVFGSRFGDRAYALEELTAELASAILGAELGLPVDHLEDHAAYIASWIAVMKGDPRAVLTVASKAEAAASYLLAAGQGVRQLAGT